MYSWYDLWYPCVGVVMTCEYYTKCLSKVVDPDEYIWPDICTLGVGGSLCCKWRNYKWNAQFDKS